MPRLIDLHTHALWGLDDGARTAEECARMLALSYDEGVREICFTPHFNPARHYAGRETVEERFAAVCAMAAERYPDLVLHLGNEVFGHVDMREALQNGQARSLGGKSAVLVEFGPDVSYDKMRRRLLSLQTAGYLPVLAHAERYLCLLSEPLRAEELARMRVRLQVNAASVCRLFPLRVHRFVRFLLRRDLLYLVASDAHDPVHRPPGLLGAYRYIEKHYGTDRAERLLCTHPARLLAGGKEKEKA